MRPAPGPADPVWGRQPGHLDAVARNVASRYAVIGVDGLIGLLLLPFNIHHLGQAAWGLWVLTSSLNTYFTVMDLGYGGSVTRFVAQYRARRDAAAINEIVSTLAVVFTGLALAVCAAFVVAALNVSRLFNLTPGQVDTARVLLLMSGTQVALGFPFSVFGGVMNGFQRYDINNVVTVATSVLVATVNVTMLLAGFTLVEMVAATTAVRVASKFVYRLNAYYVFPGLSVRPSHVRLARLREVSGFSVYVAVINWSNRLNFTTDAIVIGAFLSPAAVALWTVPRRMAQAVRVLTGQFSAVLLPVIVDADTRRQAGRLRTILVHGTRLPLLAATPLAATLFMTADTLIPAWVGPGFEESALVARILAVVIVLRVGSATASVIMKGAGEHRMLAYNNAAVALANLGLSIAWVGRYGLAGVAFGTLIPVAAGTLLNLWPRACRLAGIRAGEAFRSAVWPALWPLPFLFGAFTGIRAVLPDGVAAAMAAAAAGGICYAVVALGFGLTAGDRAVYAAKAERYFWTRKSLEATSAPSSRISIR